MQNHRPFLRFTVLLFAILSIITCPLTSGGSLLKDGASASGLRQVDYTPELTPLLLPTIPTQPFGTEVFEQHDQPSVGVDKEDVLLLQEIPDDGDPLEWIEFIEEQWENVDVVACSNGEFIADCTQWTSRELSLLYETLSDHILGEYLQEEITFVRTDDARWSGLHRSEFEDGERKSQIWISDFAWRTPPAAGLLDFFDSLFRKPEYFQGTIAHELTHAAVWFHPDLLDWWKLEKEAQGLDLEPRDWRLGLLYNWSVYDEFKEDPEVYERLIEGEFFAMTIAALMYDPWLKKEVK
jgi:hypothetical protein